MNTIKRSKEQVMNALNFLGKVKFTSAKHLQLVAGRNRRGFPTQLKKLGLVVSKEMTQGQHIFGLSKLGASLVGASQFDIHKVGLSRVEHTLVAQYETLTSIDLFQIENYEFEPQKFSCDTRPDVIWETKEGRKFFVEIELSAKSLSDGDMDRFFEKLVGRDTIIVFKESSLLGRYLKYAKQYADNGIPGWQLVDKKWFRTGGLIQVEKDAWDHVFFREHTCSGIMSVKSCIDEGLC